MIQFKVFCGTIDEIEQAFNLWAAGLPAGVNVNTGPLVRMEDGAGFRKEVLYVLPQRSNGRIDVPKIVAPKDLVN